ncbi:MAG: acyl carrier protein [Negativicutes bacterium]
MDKTMIEPTLREIISKRVAGVVPESIAPAGELAVLGIDSLAFSWIPADMEEAFGFEMRGVDIMKLKTLASAVEFVEQHAGK